VQAERSKQKIITKREKKVGYKMTSERILKNVANEKAEKCQALSKPPTARSRLANNLIVSRGKLE